MHASLTVWRWHSDLLARGSDGVADEAGLAYRLNARIASPEGQIHPKPNPFAAMNHVVRFSPAHEMRRLQRDLDGVFQEFFGPSREGDAAWTPRVDVQETEHDYILHLDVPGVQKDDLHIDFHEGTLTVRGERKAEERKEGTSYVRTERRYGSFFRAFTLPRQVNPDGITASYADGVLTVHVPKAEESKPRRITVG